MGYSAIGLILGLTLGFIIGRYKGKQQERNRIINVNSNPQKEIQLM